MSTTAGQNVASEKFISERTSYLLNPQNRNEFKDNLSRAERGALKEMRTWNKDPDNPRVIKVQDGFPGLLLIGKVDTN